MKIFGLITLVVALSVAHAQVRCRNPGSVAIPVGPCCNQVAGRGLGGALNNFFNLMDLECKFNMFIEAIIDDPDMLAFFNYISSPEFAQIALAVQDLREFQDFMWYLCDNLDLDAYLYLNTLGDILNIRRIPHPIGPNCHPEFPTPWFTQSSRKYLPKNMSPAIKKSQSPYNNGVRRFFDDLQAEIPNDAIYDMWLDKVANDPYLCRGFLKLSSVEFRAVAVKLEFHPEFITFVNKLEEWGIQMRQFMDDLKDFLWYSTYCR